MKLLTIILTLFSFTTFAQVTNKIPEYIFNNRLGVGTGGLAGDTTVYLHIGPNAGAIKGVKLPVVTDTAAVVGLKKQGLTIFSVQLNTPLYWDSINSRWKQMGGSLQHAPGTGDSLLFTAGNYLRLIQEEYGIVTTQYTNEVAWKVDTFSIPTRYTIDSLGQLIVANFESASIYNGLPSSDDTLVFWRNDSTAIIKTPVPGYGLLSDASVRTDTTMGFLVDTATLRTWIGTFAGDGDNFANADLTATGDRSHNFSLQSLTIDSLSTATMYAYTGSNYSTLYLAGNAVQLQYYADDDLIVSSLDLGEVSNKPFIGFTAQDDNTAFPQTGHMLYAWQDSIVLRSKRNNDTTNIYLGALLPTSDAVNGLGIDASGRIVQTLAGGGDTANLVILNAGSGIQTWYEVSDTLYMKRLKGTYGFNWTTDTDSSLLGTIDTTLITSRLWHNKGMDSLAAALTLTANNGLTKTGNNIALGGTALSGNTSIPTSAFSLTITSTNATQTLNVVNNTGGGEAIIANSTSGDAIQGVATGGNGVYGYSGSAWGGYFVGESAATNSALAVLAVNRRSTGTPTTNFGSNITFLLESSTTADQISGRIENYWSDATHASRTSRYAFYTVNNTTLTEALRINGNGSFYAPEYGSGTFTGTAAYNLAVTAAGDIIEVSASGGSYTFDYGLSESGGTVKVDTSAISTKAYVDQQIDLVTVGSGGTDIHPMLLISQALGSTVKFESLGRSMTDVTTTVPISDGQIRFFAVYVTETTTITGVKWFQATQGSYTADNYNGIGLYSYSGGTLTQVASTTDDGDIWKASTGTMSSKAFSSTYNASPGVYFIAVLYNSSAQTTAPALGGFGTTTTGVAAADYTNSAKSISLLSSQTALPSPTQAMSGLTATTGGIYLALY